MTMHVRVAAAALIVIGIAAGCTRTTEGTVAQTTEPGPPITTSRAPSTALPPLPELPSIPGLPDIQLPTPNTDLPEVPAPPNAVTMTCGEYSDLDDATQLAVIRAILADQGNPPGPEAETIALLMADTMCQFMPNAIVKELVLLGGSPP
jgi:hypothetical protein